MATAGEPSPQLRIDELIKQDHNKAKHLFQEYQNGKTQEMKQQLAYLLIRELSMHSCKEEEVVYPVIGRVFGPAEQQHLLDEHMELKVQLDKLNSMSVYKQEAECDELVMKIKTAFEHHVHDEETNEIPKLLKEDVDAVDLGRQFQEAAAHAVTRPHPMAPDKPPMNLAANRMTAPADALADQVRFAGHIPEVGTTTSGQPTA